MHACVRSGVTKRQEHVLSVPGEMILHFCGDNDTNMCACVCVCTHVRVHV